MNNNPDLENFTNEIPFTEFDFDLPATRFDEMSFAGDAFDIELPEFNIELPEFNFDLSGIDWPDAGNDLPDFAAYTFDLFDFVERFAGECELEDEQQTTGRPFTVSTTTRILLGYAFTLDCSVSEACEFAGISRNTYYRHLKQYPAFSETVERFKTIPLLRARYALGQAIEAGDGKAAQWYLERKRPQEFATGKARGRGCRNPANRTGRIYAKTLKKAPGASHHAA